MKYEGCEQERNANLSREMLTAVSDVKNDRSNNYTYE
jgi:hypothetical protein